MACVRVYIYNFGRDRGKGTREPGGTGYILYKRLWLTTYVDKLCQNEHKIYDSISFLFYYGLILFVCPACPGTSYNGDRKL